MTARDQRSTSTVDVAEHRATVLVHLAGMAGPQVVCAESMAAAHRELPVDRWADVLEAMAVVGAVRVAGVAGRHVGVGGARLLHAVDSGWPAVYALAPAGWAAARRLTGVAS